MVNNAPAKGTLHKTEKLDDVLLAMDVVDTLRHREQLVLRELDSEGREKELIERLREIYHAQGIEVPDRILKDGVKALQEDRFTYTPPKPSLSVQLARIYVSRDRWRKPVLGAAAFLALTTGVWHFGVEAPRQARAAAVQVELSQTIPAELASLRESVQQLSEDDSADALAETWYQEGVAAAENDDRKTARAALQQLQVLKDDLSATYSVRVVQEPGEYSGLFRNPEAAPATRNYYLIVEAVDPVNRILEVPVLSEENNAVERVKRWGVRVSKDVFDIVAADKKDDQIIQKNIIGEKSRGKLSPDYSVPTLGGAIVEW